MAVHATTMPSALQAQQAGAGREGAQNTPLVPAQKPPAAGEKAPPRKRTKAGDLDAAHVEAKVRAQHAAGALDKLSIPEMKVFLKARKLPLGGKKADLVARLGEALAHEK
jgi:hypothetical protein